MGDHLDPQPQPALRRLLKDRERDAVGHDRLAEKLVGIGYDVGGVEEVVVRQVTDRAPVIVGGEHQVPEGGLMQPLLDQAEGVAALDGARHRRPGRGTCEFAERDPVNRRASRSTMTVGIIA